MPQPEEKELEQLYLERDLYWKLLELGTQDNLRPLLEEALSLILGVTSAEKGYVALYSEESDDPDFWIAKSYTQEEVAQIRKQISSGIIAQAMATNQTIISASATSDPRFQENVSVVTHSIQAVLCAPIGLESPIGALYLQGKTKGDSFSEQDRQRAEAFVRHLVPFVDRLAARQQKADDPTRSYRSRLRLDSLVGRSRVLAEMFKQIESVARFDVSVLLTGPSGTGKTALARAIHDNSTRADKPFVELNCAALPEALVESELFGAVQGAHSTATKKLPGKLLAAKGGTLFLDEIGELPLLAQSKLLQFLNSKTYYPLGSNTPEEADVRIIAATNINIEQAIIQKTFREDLFYRLNVMPFRLPTLAERKEDISLLCDYFSYKVCRKHSIPKMSLSAWAIKATETADWPGNIRQLSHAVEAAVIRASVEGSSVLEIKHLFPESSAESKMLGEKPLFFQEATRRFQKRFVLEALEASRWHIADTAKRLGVTRAHVHNLLSAFEIRRPPKTTK
jgi:Nif-specific regulatory protein